MFIHQLRGGSVLKEGVAIVDACWQRYLCGSPELVFVVYLCWRDLKAPCVSGAEYFCDVGICKIALGAH